MAALAKSVLKLSESEAIVRIAGKDANPVTISLATDLLSTTQEIVGTPTVNIIGVQWAGEPGAIYKIDRGGVRIVTPLADNGNFIDFMGTQFPPESTNATNDIVVTIVNAAGSSVQGELWLRLRKTSGYASKIELAQFGSYDNPNVVGS